MTDPQPISVQEMLKWLDQLVYSSADTEYGIAEATRMHNAVRHHLTSAQNANGRLLPELPASFVVDELHNNTFYGDWRCRLIRISDNEQDIEGEGPTPREAVLSAISKIQERG